MGFLIQDALHSQVQHQLCSNSTRGIKLDWQMNMLLNLVAEMRQTSLAFSSLKSVTNVRTLIDIVNTLPLTVGIFSEVAKIFSMKS